MSAMDVDEGDKKQDQGPAPQRVLIEGHILVECCRLVAQFFVVMSGYKAGSWVGAHEAAAALDGAIRAQSGAEINVDLLVAGLSFTRLKPWNKAIQGKFGCDFEEDQSRDSKLTRGHIFYQNRGQKVRFGVGVVRV